MALPDFLVIGAAKAGTTSLHHYLRQHPALFLPQTKAINYFWTEAGEYGRAVPADLGAYERAFWGSPSGAILGEVSPHYLCSAGAAAKIATDLPQVRLVVSLRDPAERAWSDYLHRTKILHEHRPFEAAVAPGARCFEWGLYHQPLRRFYDTFGRERIHVLLHDELLVDTPGTLRKLLTFLGADPDVPIDTSERHNRAAVPRSHALNRLLWPAAVKASELLPEQRRGSGIAARVLALSYRQPPPFPPAARQSLQRRYAQDVLDTEALIERDLSHWGSHPSRSG